MIRGTKQFIPSYREGDAATDSASSAYRTSSNVASPPAIAITSSALCPSAAEALFAKAGIADDLDDGVIELNAKTGVRKFIDAAKQQRVWAREARLAGEAA